MDFNKTIYENRQELGRPFLVAHRGVCGANVPCNSIAAYKIALQQKADVIEIELIRNRFSGGTGTRPPACACPHADRLEPV